MPYAPFDPTRAVTFDLSLGQVHLQDSQPAVVVPASALADLCAAAGLVPAASLGHALGTALGKRIRARIASPEGSRSPIEELTVEAFVEHLSGELAISGLGALSLERWGRALLFVVDRATTPPNVLCAILESALETTTGRSSRCVQIMEEEGRARFLVTNLATAARVHAWLAQGTSWGEVLVKLHPAQEAPKPRGDA